MKFTALQIANVLGGEVEGNPQIEVYKLSKIEEGSEGSISFLANPKYKHFIYTTQASIVIVNKDFEAEDKISATLVRVDDAYAAFTKLLEFYNQVKMNKVGIEQPSFIASSAKIGQNVYIGAFVYIGENVVISDNVKIYPNTYIGDNSSVGEGTTIFAGCKIYSETVIGKDCMLHSGVVLGADGFGFQPNEKGEFSRVPQIGNVVIEDSVIAHNVEIGKNTVIAAQTGIAGSTKVGENCMIGGQVGIVGHLVIGNRVKIQAQTGVGRNLKDDEAIQGSPALGHAEYNKAYVIFRKLPNLLKRLEELEKKIK